MNDKANTMKGGLRWMYDLELVSEPVVRQNFYENIFYTDKGIKDLKIFFIEQQKSVLIWVKLGWWANLVRKNQIHSDIENVVSMLLQHYRVRIIEDDAILEKSTELYKKMYGGTHEVNNINDAVNDSKSSTSNESKLPETSDLLSDQEEQTHAGYEVRTEVEQSDLQSDKKIQNPG